MSKQQHKQDLRKIYRRETNTFYQNALHLTRLHCATFNQSALRHEELDDIIYATVSSIHPNMNLSENVSIFTHRDGRVLGIVCHY